MTSGADVYRTQAWRSIRLRVLQRDDFVCQIGLPGCTRRATAADHIVELFEGGAPFDMANLQAACRSCNSAKHMRRLSEAARRASTPLRRW